MDTTTTTTTTTRYYMDEDHCHTPAVDNTPMVSDAELARYRELASRPLAVTADEALPADEELTRKIKDRTSAVQYAQGRVDELQTTAARTDISDSDRSQVQRVLDAAVGDLARAGQRLSILTK